jgi:phosphatidylserine/phosphatidylglycerophosphate/cardiolipin synthase-like enzyme
MPPANPELADGPEPASDSESAWQLGRFLTGTEARELADHLADGDTLTAALRVIAPGRRPEARALLEALNPRAHPWDTVIVMLRAIAGARSAPTMIDPLWTMPGYLARHGRLTSSVPYLLRSARYSVVCSTFNFQRSSALWTALRDTSQRPEVTVRVYLDTAAADASPRPGSPSTEEVASHLHPAAILRTRQFDGRQVRNHAKFLAIDHRFLLISSANFSWSAEYGNVELGVLIDNQNLTESVERAMREIEGRLFEAVTPRNANC